MTARYPVGGWVPAGPARQHVTALRASGMTVKAIAERAGLSTRVVHYLSYGDQQRINAVTASVLARVSFVPGAHVLIDPTGTRRRLEALMTSGWTLLQVADRSGIEVRALGDVLASRRPMCQSRTAFAVRGVYDQLWDKPPTPWDRFERQIASRTANLARRRGYLPPLMWDDIDDPDAEPWSDTGVRSLDELAIQAGIEGIPLPLARPERDELSARLHALGRSDREIADRFGLTPDAVQKARTRLRAAA